MLVGHFQKEQKHDLLGVSHVGKPIIAQDMGKIPSFNDYFFGVRHFLSRLSDLFINKLHRNYVDEFLTLIASGVIRNSDPK